MEALKENGSDRPKPSIRTEDQCDFSGDLLHLHAAIRTILKKWLRRIVDAMLSEHGKTGLLVGVVFQTSFFNVVRRFQASRQNSLFLQMP